VDNLLSIALSNAVAATILALPAVAVGAVYRRPALVHGLWLLVLLKLVTPPLLFFPVSWPDAQEQPPLESASVEEDKIIAPAPAAEEQTALMVIPPNGEEEPADVEVPPMLDALGALTPTHTPTPAPAPVWPQLLRIVWAVGALAWFVLALERLHHFRRLLRFARPAPAALKERTRRLARSMGLKRCPRVRLLPGRVAPMLWAIGGPPRLFVPAKLLDVLSDEQLDTLLLHELAHLRRRDHWVRVLEFVVMGLYWWHPIVWFARRELREAEEQCCDAWVVSTLPGTGRTYASALLDTLDFLSTAPAAVPPLASGVSQIADLKRRLTMIMRGNTPRSLTWPGCLAVIALGLTCLPMLPALHGQAPRNDEVSKSLDDDDEQQTEQKQQAEKALKKAKEAMEQQKALLEQKKDDLKKAQAELKAAISKMVDQQKVQREIERSIQRETQNLWKRQATIAMNRNAETKGNSKIHIEIVVPDVGVNVKELTKKLNDFFPKQNARINVTMEGGPSISVSPKKPLPPAATTPPRPKTPSMPPRSPSRGQERRLEDLEQRMEKMLRELQDLRKQMRQSRPDASVAPLGLPTRDVSVPTPPGLPPQPAPPESGAPDTPPPPASGAAPGAIPAPAPAAPTPPADPTRP